MVVGAWDALWRLRLNSCAIAYDDTVAKLRIKTLKDGGGDPGTRQDTRLPGNDASLGNGPPTHGPGGGEVGSRRYLVV